MEQENHSSHTCATSVTKHASSPFGVRISARAVILVQSQAKGNALAPLSRKACSTSDSGFPLRAQRGRLWDCAAQTVLVDAGQDPPGRGRRFRRPRQDRLIASIAMSLIASPPLIA
jgi:hypothetical protein